MTFFFYGNLLLLFDEICFLVDLYCSFLIDVMKLMPSIWFGEGGLGMLSGWGEVEVIRYANDGGERGRVGEKEGGERVHVHVNGGL